MSTSAEDAAGPTATCQITTYEPEPQLELPFDNDATYVTHALSSFSILSKVPVC